MTAEVIFSDLEALQGSSSGVSYSGIHGRHSSGKFWDNVTQKPNVSGKLGYILVKVCQFILFRSVKSGKLTFGG